MHRSEHIPTPTHAIHENMCASATIHIYLTLQSGGGERGRREGERKKKSAKSIYRSPRKSS